MAGENGNGNGRPSRQIEALLQTAAVLRAHGQTWAQVAPEVNREEKTCRDWPSKHRELWTQLYTEASTKVWDEAEAEARHVQRQLLRSTDERVRQSAAHSLMACARHSRPQDLNVTMFHGLAAGLVEMIRRYVPEEQQEAAAEAVREQLGRS